MRWCQSCVLPDSRPNLFIDEGGICSACTAFRQRSEINWQDREREFGAIADAATASPGEYDCVIPVSGGKDSTWQVIKCLEYGLRPLAVSWHPPARTKIGRLNLANLIDLGVDHIDFSISPCVEAAFMRKTFEKAGSSGIPMHFAIFAVPLSIAVKFGISLIIWGENSAVEYGGSVDDNNLTVLNEAWLSKYGVSQGSGVEDWYDEVLTPQVLAAYRRPDVSVVEERGIKAVFLGHYFQWDPEISLSVAQTHGFRTSDDGPKTGYYDFADIDDDFISIHHWLKWYKFGFTRLFDNLSLEIRHGRMERERAIEIIKTVGAEKPQADIDAFCEFTGLSTAAFDDVCERFRNRDIWQQDAGIWKIHDFIVPDWNWS